MLDDVEVSGIIGDGLTEFINDFQMVHSELNNQISTSYFELQEEPGELKQAMA
jgi:hypothetical protein